MKQNKTVHVCTKHRKVKYTLLRLTKTDLIILFFDREIIHLIYFELTAREHKGIPPGNKISIRWQI